MRTLQALAVSPESMFVLVIVYAFGCRLFSYLAAVRKENAHTRRVEVALRNTKSEHRGAVVRACTALRSEAVESR